MKALQYAWLHLRRDMKNTLIALCSYLCALWVILSVQQSALSRQHMLEDMASAVEVQGYLSDATGYVKDNLDMDKYFAHLFWRENGILQPMVRNVLVKASHTALKTNDLYTTLYGITGLHAESSLMNTLPQWEDGWDETVFSTHEKVCIVGENDMHQTYVNEEDGKTYIDLVCNMYRSYYQDYKDVPITLQVIGQAPVKAGIFCPYDAFLDACSQVSSITFLVDSVSFTVRDNSKLDDLRLQVSSLFRDPKNQAAGTQAYSLVLKDAQYLELIREAQKNLAILHLMQPVLYLCALGAGVMLVVMQMRARKKEMAVVRSLGTSVVQVMCQCVLEYAFICLPATGCVLLLWPSLPPMAALSVWACFMLGALAAIMIFARIPLVRQIRELEE